MDRRLRTRQYNILRVYYMERFSGELTWRILIGVNYYVLACVQRLRMVSARYHKRRTRLYRPAGAGLVPSGGSRRCSAEISNSANAPRGYLRGYLLLLYIRETRRTWYAPTLHRCTYTYNNNIYMYVYRAYYVIYSVQRMRSTAVYNILLLFYR